MQRQPDSAVGLRSGAGSRRRIRFDFESCRECLWQFNREYVGLSGQNMKTNAVRQFPGAGELFENRRSLGGNLRQDRLDVYPRNSLLGKKIESCNQPLMPLVDLAIAYRGRGTSRF